MHFSAIPRAREDRSLWLKQWIESLLPDGSWNIMGLQPSATARGLHEKGKPLSDGKWKAGWLLEILALFLVAYKAQGEISVMQVLFRIIFVMELNKCTACILVLLLFSMCAVCLKYKHITLKSEKSESASYFSIYNVYMILL